MPGAAAPPICLDGYTPTASGVFLQLGPVSADVPAHVRAAPRVDGLVQVHLAQDAPGSVRVRAVLEREEPSTAARLAVSLPPERSRTISRAEALAVANQLGVYLDLPARADLIDPADDRFLPITGARGVTTAAAATGVRVIPETHLVGELTTAVDLRQLNRYRAMRGQLRLVPGGVEIGVPRTVVDLLSDPAAEPPTGLADPVAVSGYPELLAHLDDLARGQQARVTAIAAGESHEVSATMHKWGLAMSGRLPRKPDSILVSLPVPAASTAGPATRAGGSSARADAGRGALSERDLYWLEIVAGVLQMKLADPEVSADDPAVKALERDIEDLRGEFDEERKAQGLPKKPVTEIIFDADPATLKRWRDEGEKAARLHDEKANRAGASPQDLAEHVLRSVLHRDFFVETQALKEAAGTRPDGSRLDVRSEAGRQQFIPLVRRILGPATARVSAKDMTTLERYAREAHRDRIGSEPVRLDALRRRHGYAVLKAQLDSDRAEDTTGIIDYRLDAYVAANGVSEDRRQEILALAREMAEKDPTIGKKDLPEIFADADVVLDWAQRRYAKTYFGNVPPGPLTLDALEHLIQGKLGPAASLSRWDVQRVAEGSRARRNWRDGHASPKRLLFPGGRPLDVRLLPRPNSVVPSVVVRPAVDDGDSEQARAEEVKTLRGVLNAASPRLSASDHDLSQLVAVRRQLYAKSWDRRYQEHGTSPYRQMARELLGSNQVTPSVVRDLAELTRSISPLRVGGVDNPFNHRKIRHDLSEAARKKWRPGTEKAGPRPTLNGDGRDRSRMVTTFHSIDVGDYIPELTAWINQSVPFSGNQISEDVVARKIASLFGQTLDDGTPLEITVDGTTYDLRLWAIPTGDPKVESTSLFSGKGSGLFQGALEGRTLDFAERARWATEMDTNFFDLGVAHRFLSGMRFDGLATLGRSSATGRRVQSSTNEAHYQQIRIKETLGWVNVSVTWVLRVQERTSYTRKRDTRISDTRSGRWRELHFTDDQGRPVEHQIRYAVPGFALPYSIEESSLETPKARTDPDYLKEFRVTRPDAFPLSRMDYAVTRVQLADQVITAVRAVLSPEDYAFWKTHLERYLSNDELALNLKKILRPANERNYQQAFRVLLDSGDRHLSLSLGAKGDNPVNKVTKISKVSTSGESRFDGVDSSVSGTRDIRMVDAVSRLSVSAQLRVVMRLFRTGLNFRYPFGDQIEHFIQQSKSFNTHAVRVVTDMQKAVVDFEVELTVHHLRDRNLRDDVVERGSRTVSGFAHVMVRADSLATLSGGGRPVPARGTSKPDDTVTAVAGTSDQATGTSTPRWWNPGDGWGLTMDHVRALEGVEGLYNAIVPELVRGGHLPKAAVTPFRGATTPWDILNKMPLTGELENRPGLDYQNWQMLNRELSAENLQVRADDVMDSRSGGRGITWIFRHPDSPIRMEKAVTVTLTAKTLRVAYTGQTDYQLQYGHMNTMTTTVKEAEVSGWQAGVYLGGGATVGPVSMQGVAHGEYGPTASVNSGRTQSSSVLSDTDGQKMESRSFRAEIVWYWAVRPANTAAPHAAGAVDGAAEILQPNPINDTGTIAPLGRLVIAPGSDREPPRTTDNMSPDFMNHVMENPDAQSLLNMINATTYTTIGAWGVERMQAAVQKEIDRQLAQLPPEKMSRLIARAGRALSADPLIRSQQLESDLSVGLSRSVYRSLVPRALAASAMVPVGGQQLGVTIRPVGRPRIVKAWLPYVQLVTEAQAGKDAGADTQWQAGLGAGGFAGKSGLKPIIEDAPNSDSGNSELVLGHLRLNAGVAKRKELSETVTSGDYQGLFNNARYALVQIAVINEVRVGDRYVRTAGELVVNMKMDDVVAYAPIFDNAELIADDLAKVKSFPPPPATLTSTVLPSISRQHHMSGPTSWPMLLTGDNEQAGVAPLGRALVEAAEPFGSDGLTTYIRSVPAMMNPYMGKLLDGGMSLTYVGADGRKFIITMRAEQVDHASFSQEDEGSGNKSYERRNDARNESRRFATTYGMDGGTSGLGQPVKPEDSTDPDGFDLGLVSVTAPGGFGRTTAGGDTHGSNLLSMSGMRTNVLTSFRQNVRFYGSIEETTRDRTTRLKNIFSGSGNDRVQGFDVTVRLVVNDPKDSVTALGAKRIPLDFGLSQRLPEGAQVIYARGLGAMHAAITTAGIRGSGRVKDTNLQLNYETFPRSLRTMLTNEGAWFRSLSTADSDLDPGRRGFRVKASIAQVEDLYFVKKAEIEKYDHGTDLVSHAKVDTLRATGGLAATVAATPDGFNWVGPTGTVGRQQSKTAGTEQVHWNEHRAWLRNSMSLYVVHARLQYTVEWPGKSRVKEIPTLGHADIVLSKEDALALGIPDKALEAAAKPADPSTASAEAQRFHIMLRQAEAGLHAIRPPVDVARVDITNKHLIADGATGTGTTGTSDRPLVWYELVRSDKELVFVLRVHLTGDPGAVSEVKELTKEGVEFHLNKPGHRLPMAGRQLRVEARFVDAAQAHLTVPVVSGEAPVGQGWAAGQSPAFYAHEVLRAIGATGHRPPSDKDAAGAPMKVRDEDLQQIMDVLEPMWPWRNVPGAALQRSGTPQDLGVTGQAAGLLGGDSALSPEPAWLRTSLARIERPYADAPNLLSDVSVPGVRAVQPPNDLRTTARQQPDQYFVWLSTARNAAVDRQVFEWLNERLEQLAQAGRTPIVVTRGRVAGSAESGAGAEKRSLAPLLRRYGAAVVHEVPQSSGGLGGLNLDNSWKVDGATSATATERGTDATWTRINAAVVDAARRLIRPTVGPVSEAFGELVWGAQGVRAQFDLLRSRPTDLLDPTNVEQAARMAQRVPDSMNVALIKPLLRLGPAEPVVVRFTESTPEKQPGALLDAVTRLDGAGRLKDAPESDAATGDLVDLVKAVRLGADKAEHGRFDFTVSLLTAISQVKAGKFDDAQQFVTENRGRLEPAQKTIWVDELDKLKDRMADAAERSRLQKVLAAVYEC